MVISFDFMAISFDFLFILPVVNNNLFFYAKIALYPPFSHHTLAFSCFSRSPPGQNRRSRRANRSPIATLKNGAMQPVSIPPYGHSACLSLGGRISRRMFDKPAHHDAHDHQQHHHRQHGSSARPHRHHHLHREEPEHYCATAGKNARRIVERSSRRTRVSLLSRLTEGGQDHPRLNSSTTAVFL